MTERPQHDPAQTDADDDVLAPDDEFLGDDDDTDEPPGEWLSGDALPNPD
jgi:hypothetical protein